jgi:hypothetical protein
VKSLRCHPRDGAPGAGTSRHAVGGCICNDGETKVGDLSRSKSIVGNENVILYISVSENDGVQASEVYPINVSMDHSSIMKVGYATRSVAKLKGSTKLIFGFT